MAVVRAVFVAAMLATASYAQGPARPVRFMLHGNMSHELPTEEYLRFVEEAKPDILIMGVFDQRLYSLASPSANSKKPPLDPVEHLVRWKGVAERLQRSGIRLIGQMEMFVVSDQPKELADGTGWFGFYDKQWNEKLLGKRPTKSLRDLLAHSVLPERLKEDKTALCGCRVNTKAILGCVNNPHWAEVQKRMMSAAIAHGVDGFMTNRNFFEHCDCSYCQEHFRRWLAERFRADELKSRFGIANLPTHRFACVTGNNRTHDILPDALHLEKMRFIKNRVRDFFEQVYVQHGRGIRKDLFVSQWNHMAYFDELHLDKGHLPPSTRTNLAHALADERWGVPAKLWGKGENLLWYCNWGTTQNTILAKEYAGDTVLYGLYLRAMARGKPYVINKYDFYRPRVMMAEAAALGYATNAIATPWQHADDREVVLQYFRFLRKHEDFYVGSDRHAEIGLVFPRRAIEAGDASPLEYTEACGRSLIREQLLFDMVPDELLSATDLSRFRMLVVAAPEYLSKEERAAIERYAQAGGIVLWTQVSAEDRARAGASSPDAKRWLIDSQALPKGTRRIENARTDRAAFVAAVNGSMRTWSRAEAPWTVQIHAYRQAKVKRWVIHLVNYNHQENAKGQSVSAREAPIVTGQTPIRMQLPTGAHVKRIRFLSPDAEAESVLDFQQTSQALRFTAPAFLAYGICVIEE
ncbi:MAG: hypothetical protein FJ303_24345 [Planctomycetes bacterium]|nr:hypothetical protein [Planctomycetota bacterium]